MEDSFKTVVDEITDFQLQLQSQDKTNTNHFHDQQISYDEQLSHKEAGRIQEDILVKDPITNKLVFANQEVRNTNSKKQYKSAMSTSTSEPTYQDTQTFSLFKTNNPFATTLSK